MRALGRMTLWFLELVGAIAFFLLCILAILPWLLSMQETRALILRLATKGSSQQITIQEASFSWFGSQTIKGISVEDPERHARLCIEQVSTDASLWQILVTTHDVGLLHITHPSLSILVNDPILLPPTDVQQAGFSSSTLTNLCYPNHKLIRLFSGQIVTEEGTIEISGPHIDTVYFQNVSLEADIHKPGETISFRTRGDTSQKSMKDEITGNFFLNGTLSSCENASTGGNLALQGGISRLPVLGIDQMLSLARPEMQGFLPAALGSTLDLTATALLGSDKGEFALELSSSQMKAKLYATTQEGKIVLRSPATCSLAVTPGLVNFFLMDHPLLSHLKLAYSSQMLVTIQTLSLPYHGTSINWDELDVKADMHLTNTGFDTPALSHRIDLKEIQATLTAPRLQKELLIDAHMKLQYGGVSSAVASVAQIDSPLNNPSFKAWTLSADQFPVTFIDHLLMKNGSFAAILGDAVNLNFALEPEKDKLRGTLYVSTSQLVIEGAVLTVKPYLQLEKPLDVFYRPTSEWMKRYFPEGGVTPVKITVKEFSLGDSLSTLAMHIEARSDSFSLNQYKLVHPEVIADVKGLDNIDLAFRADGLGSEIHMSYQPEEKILSTKDTTKLTINLQTPAWTAFAACFTQPTQLLKPALATVEVKPFTIVFNNRPFAPLIWEGNVQVVDFMLTNPNKPQSRFALKETSLRWKWDNAKREFFARGQGQITGATDSWSPFLLESLVHNLPEFGSTAKKTDQPSTADSVCKIAINALDTSALDLWIASSHSLGSLVGSPLNLKLDMVDKTTTRAFSVEAKSDRLQLNCGVACEGQQLLLRSSRQPIVMNWTVYPEGFALGTDLWEHAFQEPFPLKLNKPTPIALRIDTLSLPVQENCYRLAPDALKKGLFSGNLSAERVPFTQKNSEEPLTLQHVELNAQRQRNDAPLQFSLQSTIEAAKSGLAELRGSIQASTTLQTNIEANFQNIPTIIPDLTFTLTGAKPRTLTTIFGPTITGSLQANITDSNGPLTLHINSPSTRVQVNGDLHHGILTLQEPLVAQVTLTKDFSRNLLEQTNPLSVDIITSEGPITLTVDKEGFALPLFPWDLSQASIGHARIDLGRITCHNKGNINDLLGLLKQSQFSRNKDLKLWFAPMDLSLKNGILDCERTEILVADQIDICTWGKVDLYKNRVNAILGLTSQALQSAFGLQNLPADYVLQLPMKGPIGDVKINTKKATAKIALLLASQQVNTQKGGILGGSKGAIVGGILGGIAKLPDYKTPSPPAKHPFPWESASETPQQNRGKKKTKSTIKPNDRPLKQLIKLFRP